jgi:hypothetical protein
LPPGSGLKAALSQPSGYLSENPYRLLVAKPNESGFVLEELSGAWLGKPVELPLDEHPAGTETSTSTDALTASLSARRWKRTASP